MGKEIERKFLVKGDLWRNAEGIWCRQGYLNGDRERTVRVRTLGDQGFITVKGVMEGLTRLEFEYRIPLSDAEKMLSQLCEQPFIEKRRFRVPCGATVFEVDEFFGKNSGLILAEVELESENQPFERPEWLGKEVSGEPKYFNSNLFRHPYGDW